MLNWYKKSINLLSLRKKNKKLFSIFADKNILFFRLH